MATIVTRAGKGSPLTSSELDQNQINLNTDKAELSGAVFTGAITTNSTIDGRDVAADGATADAALPKSGGAMTGAITTNSTFDGVDIATRDAVLTSTTTTANAALPKAGGAMTGAITTNSTFDGRDVATDGTKLDGIEASATADQTGAQIKTAYEAQTNAFTDAQFTKLGGIEASATADQTAAEIRALVESATDSNVFTDADHTKLNGVEASADVTDTANVTAAGALMDSELTAIASVKALNQGVATGDSPTFAALTSTGEITANGGIALGDNDKATFGASDDLQIYHTGSYSAIADVGTGAFYIGGADFVDIGNSTLSETSARFHVNDRVDLYHNNAIKLATTATGIDVTGTATVDGLVSSGNVLVAGTNTNPVGNNVVGHALSSDGRVQHSTIGNTVMKTNQTTDGDILQFRKVGASVGSIGTVAGRLGIGTGDAGLFFDDDNNKIGPVTMTSGTPVDRDGLLDLGYSGARFKDLYLSGGVYLGGTGAANKLDDYEEGSWAPSIGAGITAVGTVTTSGTYTKVGRIVTLQFKLSATTSLTVSNGNTVLCGTLPFQMGGNHSMSFMLLNSTFEEAKPQSGWSYNLYSSTAMAATPNLYATLTYVTT